MELTSLFDLIQKYDGLIGIIAMLFIGWLGTKFVAKDYFAGFEKAQTAQIKDICDKIDRVEDRVTLVEKDMEHLPDKGSFHRMELSLVKLEGRLEAMDEKLKPVAEMARRSQDYLMSDKT